MRHNETAAEPNAGISHFTDVTLLFYEITTDVHRARKIFNMIPEYFRNLYSQNMTFVRNI